MCPGEQNRDWSNERSVLPVHLVFISWFCSGLTLDFLIFFFSLEEKLHRKAGPVITVKELEGAAEISSFEQACSMATERTNFGFAPKACTLYTLDGFEHI